MPDIFLSYSRDDQATARRFAEGFERAGLSVWWDQTLNAGEAYDEVTEKALEEARAVVVLWSKKSVASRWVRAEATQADRSGTLVPAMIEDCKRPIMFELKQTADLSNWTGDANDRDWQAYLASVRRLVEKSGPVAGSSAPAATANRKRSRPAAIAIGIGVLLVAALGFWLLSRMRSIPATVQPAAPTATAAAGAGAPVSIAVLPFVNMSSDPEQEYFSDGLSEELLNQLAQVPDLRVIGRTSSFAFKGKNEDLRHIGEVLGVNHLLEGSVRKSGNRVKITAQLINPADGSHLWSETYERSLDDIFAIQEEIAKTVARELQVRMGTASNRGAGTKNIAAYDEFLAGRALLNTNDPASMQAAAPHLERAVGLDPGYVQAWLWLVDAYIRATPSDTQKLPQYELRLNAAIDRVVALSPNSPEASFALSYRAGRERDLISMDRLLRESLVLTGGQGVRARFRHGQFLESMGRVKEAVAKLEQVRKDDPLDIFTRSNLVLAYELNGENDRADAEMQQLLELSGGRTPALLGTAVSRAMGRHDEAKLREALAALSDVGQDVSGTDGKALLDDPAAAPRKLHQQYDVSRNQSNIYTMSGIAQWAAYFGDRDLALQAIETMSHKGYSFEIWGWILWRPVMRDIRRDPGFKKLVTEFGIARYWRAAGNWGDFCKPVGKDDFECK